MNGFHHSVTAAVVGEHHNDLLRAAARSRMIADLPDRDRHQTPRHRAAWWSRVTSFVTHRTVAASA